MTGYKLVNSRGANGARAGLLVGDQVIDIGKGLGEERFARIEALLEEWDAVEPRLDHLSDKPDARRVPLDTLTLLAPVPAPLAVYCIGANFQQHLDNMMRAQNSPPQANSRDAGMPPFFFLKSGHCIVPTGVEIELNSTMLDWEAELVVVIGRKVRKVSAGEAMASIAGYTVANDLSARDRVVRKNGSPTSPFFYDFVAQKSFDGSCPLGPAITPAKFVADPQALAIRLWVNDRLRIDSNSSEMIYPISEQIAFLSSFVTLYPGDLILTGTPAGVGAETGEYLKAGDQVRVEVEGLGVIENRLV